MLKIKCLHTVHSTHETTLNSNWRGLDHFGFCFPCQIPCLGARVPSIHEVLNEHRHKTKKKAVWIGFVLSSPRYAPGVPQQLMAFTFSNPRRMHALAGAWLPEAGHPESYEDASKQTPRKEGGSAGQRDTLEPGVF